MAAGNAEAEGVAGEAELTATFWSGARRGPGTLLASLPPSPLFAYASLPQFAREQMIKPVDQMTDGERWLWIEMEMAAIKRRQTITLSIVSFIAASVAGVVIPRLVTFLLSGIVPLTP